MEVHKGKRGEDIRVVQMHLLRHGYPLPRFGADGIWGDETSYALAQFEKDRRHFTRSGLFSTPVLISQKTLQALLSSIVYQRAIDVSHHQGKIDWKQVKAEGYPLAYLKAAQGSSHIDRRFKENYDKAKEAGLMLGAYHFVEPAQSSQAQMKHFAKVLEGREGEMLPVLDIEKEVGGLLGLPSASNWMKDLYKAAQEILGCNPMIYSSLRIWSTYRIQFPEAGMSVPLWIVNWKSSEPILPKTWEDWTVWQTGFASGVRGIEGDVDRNLVKEVPFR